MPRLLPLENDNYKRKSMNGKCTNSKKKGRIKLWKFKG